MLIVLCGVALGWGERVIDISLSIPELIAMVGNFFLKFWDVFLVNLLKKLEFVIINYSPLFF